MSNLFHFLIFLAFWAVSAFLALPFHSAAIRARHGAGISSVFMLVATLITASVTACPVKSAAVSICAKARHC